MKKCVVKLSKKKVELVKKLRSKNYKISAIAEKFGVHCATIECALANKTWA